MKAIINGLLKTVVLFLDHTNRFKLAIIVSVNACSRYFDASENLFCGPKVCNLCFVINFQLFKQFAIMFVTQ